MLLKDEDGHMGLVERGWPEEKTFIRVERGWLEEKTFIRESIESRRRWVQG